MSRNGSTASTRFDRNTVRSVSRVAIAALALVGVLSLFTMLPGMDRLVPLTPVTFAAVVTATFTLAVVVLLAYAAPRLAALTRVSIHRPDGAEEVSRVAEGVGSVVHWLVILVAVLVAHAGLAGVVTPLLDEVVWAYDAAFLVVSLVPLVFLVVRLAVTIDPMSELIADRVAGAESADDADPAQATDDADSKRGTDEAYPDQATGAE
ncbi:hypothetical protein [Halorubrum tibetense]|uniref:DUF2975 domain-containing protein n=1 Tax=Halorubrum tibetense TaxID=175631 RepID=A0ABD5S972_9EURY